MMINGRYTRFITLGNIVFERFPLFPRTDRENGFTSYQLILINSLEINA